MMKKFIKALSLIISLLLCMCPIPSLAEPTAPAWNYDNSIVVNVSVPEQKNFIPADFPEVGNSGVLVVKKANTENGFNYELILTLTAAGTENCAAALESIKKNLIVTSASRNIYAPHDDAVLALNYSRIRFPVGKTFSLNVTKFDVPPDTAYWRGVCFTLNSSLTSSEKDSIMQAGILHFWPETNLGQWILQQQPGDLEFTESNSGIYYGLINGSNAADFISVTNSLAQVSGISAVSIVIEPVAPGTSVSETWSADPANSVDMAFPSNDSIIKDTANITVLKPGKINVCVKRDRFVANCVVLAPGDLNNDHSFSVVDALIALRISIGKIQADEDTALLGDLDGNGLVETNDALVILKTAVGKRDLSGNIG